jgi:quinoprotein dehydrogenase-associated probable ABC transporter substrate-binding protein
MGGSLYGNESLKADAMARVGGHNLLTCLAACGAAIVAAAPVVSVGQERGAVEELVDPNVLRVCADPNNLPFSNERGEGFENKLGELFAAKLGKKLAYTFFPQATGFVRMTLGSHRCDVIMGYPQGDEMVQNTNPYYQTAYALVAKRGGPLEGVEALADPRLQDKRIGIVAGTPPATYLVGHGLMAKAKPYPLVVDTRFDSSAVAMMNDLASGAIDAGILWGPIAGYRASVANPSMHVELLLKETGGPRLTYRITMGVRPTDQNWKRQLNKLIAENQSAIDKLLFDFNVPLLDANGRPLAGNTSTQKQ